MTEKLEPEVPIVLVLEMSIANSGETHMKGFDLTALSHAKQQALFRRYAESVEKIFAGCPEVAFAERKDVVQS